MAKSPGFRKSVASRLTLPVVRLLTGAHVTPDAVSWFGFAVAIGAAVLIATEHLFAGGFVVLVAGFFDILDGALARNTNRVSRFGAALDSFLDRLSEAIWLLAILIVYARAGSFAGLILVFVTLISSQMVSYIRAKAEALGLECQVGWCTRPERVIILALGLLLSQIEYALITALWVIAVFSVITAGQRLVHVWRQTKVG